MEVAATHHSAIDVDEVCQGVVSVPRICQYLEHIVLAWDVAEVHLQDLHHLRSLLCYLLVKDVGKPGPHLLYEDLSDFPHRVLIVYDSGMKHPLLPLRVLLVFKLGVWNDLLLVLLALGLLEIIWEGLLNNVFD